jgi:hypothetical protein
LLLSNGTRSSTEISNAAVFSVKISNSPQVAAAKRLLNATYSAEEARALRLESEVQERLIGGWNQVSHPEYNHYPGKVYSIMWTSPS